MRLFAIASSFFIWLPDFKIRVVQASELSPKYGAICDQAGL
jgi:hypothetical protein